jgi:hypothetical protein
MEEQAVAIMQFVVSALEFGGFYCGGREFVPADLGHGGLRGIGIPQIGIITGAIQLPQ